MSTALTGGFCSREEIRRDEMHLKSLWAMNMVDEF